MYFQHQYRSSEVLLGRKKDYSACHITEGNIEYYTLNRWMDRAKTETNQDVAYFPERVHFLKDIYWAAGYHSMFDDGENEFLFPSFSQKVLNEDNGTIESDSANLFTNIYEKLKEVLEKVLRVSAYSTSSHYMLYIYIHIHFFYFHFILTSVHVYHL